MKYNVVAVDFDGTLVEHRYPDIGREVPGAVDAVKWLVENNVKIVLFTMRSGEYLSAAVAWMVEHDIIPWGINTNPDQKSWTDSPKAYAQVYIDDAAFGCPLIYPNNSLRPYVDWSTVKQELTKRLGL
jgi:hypothetical protein